MKLFRTSAFSGSLTTLALAGVAATTAGVVGAGSAAAGPTVRLPGQVVTKTLKDGTKVTLTRSGETATISPSMGGTPLHRNVLVSGRYKVAASDKQASLSIGSGYIVGCQLTLGGAADGTATATGSYLDASAATVEASTGAGITIGPGVTADYVINDIESKDSFGRPSHSSSVSFTGDGTVVYKNQAMMVNGCAGYAQARSYAAVYVTTDTVSDTFYVYGKPFSMG
ncbi:hypothetical protein GCM10009624_29780 [Gordonia sinesedis]